LAQIHQEEARQISFRSSIKGEKTCCKKR